MKTSSIYIRISSIAVSEQGESFGSILQVTFVYDKTQYDVFPTTPFTRIYTRKRFHRGPLTSTYSSIVPPKSLGRPTSLSLPKVFRFFGFEGTDGNLQQCPLNSI
jgi:hypothetical protein